MLLQPRLMLAQGGLAPCCKYIISYVQESEILSPYYTNLEII